MTELVPPNDDSAAKRASVLGLVGLLLFLHFEAVSPFLGAQIRRVASAEHAGLDLFLRHLLVFSLPLAAGCLLAHLVLSRMGVVRPLALPRTRHALGVGLLFGGAATLLTVLEWAALGRAFQFAPHGWSILGNLFSNLYEETFYRVLLIPVLLYAFRNAAAAVVGSSLIFALTHHAYPFFLQVAVFAAGLCFGLAFLRTGNLLAPWAAHQLSDVVLDTILKP